MATTTLNIQGMTCNGCVNSVTRVLTGITGVSRADVDLAGAKAVVEYDAAQTTPAACGMRFQAAFVLCGRAYAVFRLPILWRAANKRWLLFGCRIGRWFRW